MHERLVPRPWELFVNTSYFDNPLSFILGSDPKGKLKNMGYFRLTPYYGEDARENLANPPPNAPSESDIASLLLERHFPQSMAKPHDALAICSLGGQVVPDKGKQMQVATIQQIQAARYASEASFLRDMNGLDFKKLFVHCCEQLVLHTAHKGARVDAIGIAIQDRWDSANVIKRLLISRAELYASGQGKNILELRMNALHAKRRELAAKLGYARTTQGENAPWIKHINQVGPDRRLQAFFEGKVHLK